MSSNLPYESVDRAEAIREVRGKHYECECLKAQRTSLAVRVTTLLAQCDGIENFDTDQLTETADDLDELATELRGVAHGMEVAECAKSLSEH